MHLCLWWRLTARTQGEGGEASAVCSSDWASLTSRKISSYFQNVSDVAGRALEWGVRRPGMRCRICPLPLGDWIRFLILLSLGVLLQEMRTVLCGPTHRAVELNQKVSIKAFCLILK